MLALAVGEVKGLVELEELMQVEGEGLEDWDGKAETERRALSLTLEVTLALALALTVLHALELADKEGEVLTLALLDAVVELEAAPEGVVEAEGDEDEDSVDRLSPSRLTVGLDEGTKVFELVGLTLTVEETVLEKKELLEAEGDRDRVPDEEKESRAESEALVLALPLPL